MSREPVTVVYGVDPLCGWCFAIGEQLREARAQLAGEVTWEVALGGLVTGERVRPIALDADYLRRGLAQVEQASGRRAAEAYWTDLVGPGTWVSDSGPVVAAVVAVRDLAGDEAAMDLAHLLCDRMYLSGRAPDDPDQVRAGSAALGLDPDAVLARWRSDEGQEAAQAENARARALGVTTYPSLFVRQGRQLTPVLAGYAPAPVIVDTIRQLARRSVTA